MSYFPPYLSISNYLLVGAKSHLIFFLPEAFEVELDLVSQQGNLQQLKVGGQLEVYVPRVIGRGNDRDLSILKPTSRDSCVSVLGMDPMFLGLAENRIKHRIDELRSCNDFPMPERPCVSR